MHYSANNGGGAGSILNMTSFISLQVAIYRIDSGSSVRSCTQINRKPLSTFQLYNENDVPSQQIETQNDFKSLLLLKYTFH